METLDTTKISHGEPIGFDGVIYQNMGKILLRGIELTQRLLTHQSQPQVAAHEIWKPETHYKACR